MSNNEDIFRSYGVEVELAEPDDFLKVRETLTRIGVARTTDKTLFQSCHILHKRGRYAIIHFKELYALDGKYDNVNEEDIARRNRIVKILAEWGMVKEIDPSKTEKPLAFMNGIKVIRFGEKDEWQLTPKYNIGVK